MANRRNRTEVISQTVPPHVMAAIRAEVRAAEVKAEVIRAEMQAAEDHRANRRNRNRAMLLVLTIVNTFIAVNILNGMGLHWLVVKYPATSVAFGFLMDLVFVIFAWRRKM